MPGKTSSSRNQLKRTASKLQGRKEAPDKVGHNQCVLELTVGRKDALVTIQTLKAPVNATSLFVAARKGKYQQWKERCML